MVKFCTIGAGLVSAYLLYAIAKKSNKHLNVPPGSLGYPIIGESLSFVASPTGFSSERRDKHGAIFKSHILGSPTVCVSRLEHLRQIFREEKKGNIGVSWPRAWRALMGKTAIAVRDEPTFHHAMRKMLNPLFGQKRITGMVPSLHASIRASLEKWAESGEIINGSAAARIATMAINLTIFATDDFRGEEEEFDRIVSVWMSGFMSLFMIRLPGFLFYSAMNARETLLARFQEVIANRRRLGAQLPNRGETIDDVFHHMIFDENEIGERWTDEEIIDTLITVIFASYDTTSNTLSNMLCTLKMHPECCTKLQEEISRVFLHGNETRPREVTMEKIRECVYVDAFLKECLRTYRPIANTFRVAKENIRVGDYDVPKGYAVAIGVEGVLQFDKYWKDPDAFRPERFLEDRIVPQSFMVFGAGVRQCLGRYLAVVHLKLWLILMFTEFEVNVQPGFKYLDTLFHVPGSKVRIAVRKR